MKRVIADFNRRGPEGRLEIALRRFVDVPKVGEHFIAVDGEDKFEGVVDSIDATRRSVLMKMNWGAGALMKQLNIGFAFGQPGRTSSGSLPSQTLVESQKLVCA